MWQATRAGGASTAAGRQDLPGSREASSKGCPPLEMKMLPLKWEARSRCIDFWLKVLRMGGKWLIRSVMF